jgi:hypothetical protein
MKTPQRLFADLTAAIEDLHAVAVDGQAISNSPDMQAALLVPLRQGIACIVRIANSIERSLPGGDT